MQPEHGRAEASMKVLASLDGGMIQGLKSCNRVWGHILV